HPALERCGGRGLTRSPPSIRILLLAGVARYLPSPFGSNFCSCFFVPEMISITNGASFFGGGAIATGAGRGAAGRSARGLGAGACAPGSAGPRNFPPVNR